MKSSTVDHLAALGKSSVYNLHNNLTIYIMSRKYTFDKFLFHILLLLCRHHADVKYYHSALSYETDKCDLSFFIDMSIPT